MENKDIGMKSFKNIEEVYNFIDINIYDLEKSRDLTQIWVNYRNSTLKQQEKEKAQWEIDYLLFDLKGGKLFSQIYTESNEEVKLIGYPELNKIQNDSIDNLIIRAKIVSNPILKAKYNHLLWKCPNGIKHNNYAITAFESYIESIENFLDKSNNELNYSIQIDKLFENLMALTNTIKIDLKPLKKLTKKLLFNSNFEFYTKHGILNDMLSYPKLFKAIDFENTLSIFEDELKNKKENSDDFSIANYYTPTAIKIATKINSNIKKWYNEKGLAFLRMADTQKTEDRFWIKLNFYSSALEAFVQSGDKNLKTKTETLYFQLKPKVKLSNVRIDFDEETIRLLKDFNEKIRGLAKRVLEQKPEDVYLTISGGFFFPKYSDVLKASGKNKSFFLSFITTIKFDQNKNIKNKQEGSEIEKSIFDTYCHQIESTVLHYLHYILIPGIKSGKLTFENFMEFLIKKTWIGKPNLKYDLSDEEKSINWMGLLNPSIAEFFLQIQGWVSTKYYNPNFVLCIDSLTLKIEGLLRDFCNRMSIPTSVSRKGSMQEIYINNILDNDIIKQYFNEDDLLFFNYLFSSKNGLNIRNNVAHSFYNYKDYHLDKMLLLIAALLRLAKYDIIIEKRIS